MAVVLNGSVSYEHTQVHPLPPNIRDYVLTDCLRYVDQVKTCNVIMTGGAVAVMVCTHFRLYNSATTSVRGLKEPSLLLYLISGTWPWRSGGWSLRDSDLCCSGSR